MKRLVAVWLLVGLSLGVPQFGKGEVTGQGSLNAGRAGSAFWKCRSSDHSGSSVRAWSGERHSGGDAPWIPRESASKVRVECPGLSLGRGCDLKNKIEGWEGAIHPGFPLPLISLQDPG